MNIFLLFDGEERQTKIEDQAPASTEYKEGPRGIVKLS